MPDLNDVTGGFKVLLAPGGTISIEFPHLVRLIEGNQFDTIYHEHFSYFTLHTSSAALGRARPARVRRRGAAVARRLAAPVRGPRGRPTADLASAVVELLAREKAAGYTTVEGHPPFAERVAATKRALLAFLSPSATPAGRSPPTGRRARPTRCSTTAASGPT